MPEFLAYFQEAFWRCRAGRKLLFKKKLFDFIYWLHCSAYGILVPWPGIEPLAPALEAWSFNHWTAREIPGASFWHLVHQVPPQIRVLQVRQKQEAPKCLWFLFQKRTQCTQVSLEHSNHLNLITWGLGSWQLMSASAMNKQKHLWGLGPFLTWASVGLFPYLTPFTESSKDFL